MMKSFQIIIVVRRKGKSFGYGITAKGRTSDEVADKVRRFFRSERFEILDLEIRTRVV